MCLLVLSPWQCHSLDLNSVTPVRIFELMFQSPDNSVSQDDVQPTGKCLSRQISLQSVIIVSGHFSFYKLFLFSFALDLLTYLLTFSFFLLCPSIFPSLFRCVVLSFALLPVTVTDSLVEAFGLDTPSQPAVTDTPALLPTFSQAPSSSSSSSPLAGPVVSLDVSLQAVSVSVPSQPSSTTPLPTPPSSTFVPLSASVQTPELQTISAVPVATGPQHYVALQPKFLQQDGSSASQPVAVTVPPSVPDAVPSVPDSSSTVVATETDPPSLTAPPPPPPPPPLPPPPTTTTITITPTHGMLPPGLVVSNQDLQWILSSATNSQINSEQQVRL